MLLVFFNFISFSFLLFFFGFTSGGTGVALYMDFCLVFLVVDVLFFFLLACWASFLTTI